MKKKVLFAATVYTHLAHFHIPFIQQFQQKGFEVHAIGNPNEGGKEKIEGLGVICHTIHFSRSPFSIGHLRASRELKTLFNNYSFDLIHVHTPIASFLVRYFAKQYNQGPVLYTAHGFHFHKGSSLLNWFLYYPVEKTAKKWTDGLIVINEEDYQLAQKMGYTPGQNLFITHGVGVDLTHYNKGVTPLINIRKELAIQDDDVVITCVAEFSINKNHELLVSAWKKLLVKHDHIHLLLVGTGSQEQHVRAIVQEEQIQHVHFLGYRHDVHHILKCSDVITLVSKREGLPKSIMEGMALGLPAIVTNVRGSRDLVNHTQNGLLTNGEVTNLEEHLSTLIEDKATRQRMGNEALLKVKNYSVDHVLSELDQIYERFLQHNVKVISS
ncbi:glycosyltransferase involved in cell wall biosynthesis [Bacillus mesophilus]|uniref:Glycosyltransferase family 4 protein n=1 Tax=Bacillus mesophilus TaxID=1808955 RepID=A0A6M0Q7T5_9BACI|nr:glycosyltransferase family 4 protein [Bacillus mesophilus]MBM7661645.1 glycosyltransferase involved in cell wall biosynthesis [Bacillus mesophilus]NEY72313.1 glycosyltransferase family 4 protein [Bacillus mesophilus]